MKSFYSQWLAIPVGQRRFLLALAMLVLVPFFVLVGLQIRNAVALARISEDISVSQNDWKARSFALNANIDPATLADPLNAFSYRLLAQHDEMVPERRAVVTLEVPLYEDRQGYRRLSEDEALGAASAEVQARAAAECRLMTADLAAECAVMSATGRQTGAETFEYQFQLSFREKKPLGKYDKTKHYAFLPTTSTANSGFSRQRVYFRKSEDVRSRIYADIAATCSRIRKSAGNCSVTAISVSSRLDRGTPIVRIAASASYGSLVLPTKKAMTAQGS